MRRIMNGAEGPLDILVLGLIVAQAVETSAQERDLHCERPQSRQTLLGAPGLGSAGARTLAEPFSVDLEGIEPSPAACQGPRGEPSTRRTIWRERGGRDSNPWNVGKHIHS